MLHSHAFAPHPPAPFAHKGRRGSLGVLMPETEDGTRGLAKTSTPVRSPPAPFAHTGRRGSLGVLMPETEDGTQGLPQKPAPVRAPTPQADICYNLALAPSYQIGMEALRVHSGMFRPVNSMGGQWSLGTADQIRVLPPHHGDHSWRLAFCSSVRERYGCADHNPDPSLDRWRGWDDRPAARKRSARQPALVV